MLLALVDVLHKQNRPHPFCLYVPPYATVQKLQTDAEMAAAERRWVRRHMLKRAVAVLFLSVFVHVVQQQRRHHLFCCLSGSRYVLPHVRLSCCVRCRRRNRRSTRPRCPCGIRTWISSMSNSMPTFVSRTGSRPSSRPSLPPPSSRR